MRIAIIGTGNVGNALATALRRAGHEIPNQSETIRRRGLIEARAARWLQC